MSFGPLFFAAPLALFALIALPLLIWLIRATPPAPTRAVFPPLRLLLGLTTEEESRKRAPLWLVLLRAFAAALLILGFARPSLSPPETGLIPDGPILIVVDDGWTSAPGWTRARAAAEQAASEAERARQPVHLLFTAPARTAQDPGETLNGADARARLARLEPKPWRPDRADAAKRLERAPKRLARVIWISDGLASAEAETFAKALTERGPLAVRYPEALARAVTASENTQDGLSAQVRRAPGGLGTGAIAAETLEGRALAASEFRFEGGAAIATVRFELPPEIAARAARVRLVGEASAGAVRLLPAGSGRPVVGLVDPAGQPGQALLQDLFYVDRAIAPYASARRGAIQSLIDQGAQALIVPDASRIAPADQKALTTWLDKGGLLIRFAGPRLANAGDEFLPVRLRPGARTLGGALAWEQPQSLAPFPSDSPFAGLEPPADVAVRRQVLAEPSAEREARIWARLADGAPVVSAAARGQGLIVLFHVSAGPDWSDLPLSGLFVDMLRRALQFSGRAAVAAEGAASADPWLPERLVDGFGQFQQPGADAQPVEPSAMAEAVAGPMAPPGLYARAGSASAAIDAAGPSETLEPLPLPAGATRLSPEGPRALALAGPLLALAAVLAALDLLIALALAGRLPRLRAQTAGAGLTALLALGAAPAAQAQYEVFGPRDFYSAGLTPPRAFSQDPTLDMRLAYLRTGDARLDRQTEAGLVGLTRALTDRTAVEPAPPRGVDPAKDDLSPYPVIYWAAPDQPVRLSDAAIANLDRYMRLGGLVFLDTRDAPSARARNGANGPGPAAILLQGFDAPPLAPVDGEHVLTKAFYISKSFPGRFTNARVWAETASAAAARDGVPSLMVGDGDWAAAWADGAPSRQRELSLRFGVNLVMVALTGNYKADQVHVGPLLERLGQPPNRPALMERR